MSTYIILHREPAFRGVWAGIDFYDGRGSVSSLEDVRRLIPLGARAEDPGVQAQAEALLRGEAALRAHQAPKSDLDAAERTPGWKGTRRKSHRGPQRTG